MTLSGLRLGAEVTHVESILVADFLIAQIAYYFSCLSMEWMKSNRESDVAGGCFVLSQKAELAFHA